MGKNFLTCSVIVPCFNEAGNIEECIKRIPKMGEATEIIVVDDHSTDDTVVVVKKIMQENRYVRLISLAPNRTKKGKGSAVKSGFDAASGDVIMILDADMTVSPEELPKFFNLLVKGKAQFANGTRMIYPMEKGAMKNLNFLGNKIFSLILSLIVNQKITDTLCGTKALLKKDYLNMKMGLCPWGDLDLLLEASRLKLKMIEVPVHYRKRVTGESKMRAFKHGWQFLRICFKALKKIKIYSVKEVIRK